MGAIMAHSATIFLLISFYYSGRLGNADGFDRSITKHAATDHLPLFLDTNSSLFIHDNNICVVKYSDNVQSDYSFRTWNHAHLDHHRHLIFDEYTVLIAFIHPIAILFEYDIDRIYDFAVQKLHIPNAYCATPQISLSFSRAESTLPPAIHTIHSLEPTKDPTTDFTEEPTATPTYEPTVEPIRESTAGPIAPTMSSTIAPTPTPTINPTIITNETLNNTISTLWILVANLIVLIMTMLYVAIYYMGFNPRETIEEEQQLIDIVKQEIQSNPRIASELIPVIVDTAQHDANLLSLLQHSLLRNSHNDHGLEGVLNFAPVAIAL